MLVVCSCDFCKLLASRKPAAILDLIAGGEIVARVCVSPVLLAEYRDVLTRPNPYLDPKRVWILLELMPRISFLVTPTHQLSVCKTDEDDNRVLECGEGANVDYLITGNTKYFPAEWKILKPRAFLDLWQKQGKPK